MLNYQQTETFIIEDVDHVYHIVKIKIEQALFLILTLTLPMVLNVRGLYAFLLFAAEFVLFQRMTEAEIRGRPYQYDSKFMKRIQRIKILKKMVRFKITWAKDQYRGDL